MRGENCKYSRDTENAPCHVWMKYIGPASIWTGVRFLASGTGSADMAEDTESEAEEAFAEACVASAGRGSENL